MIELESFEEKREKSGVTLTQFILTCITEEQKFIIKPYIRI